MTKNIFVMVVLGLFFSACSTSRLPDSNSNRTPSGESLPDDTKNSETLNTKEKVVLTLKEIPLLAGDAAEQAAGDAILVGAIETPAAIFGFTMAWKGVADLVVNGKNIYVIWKDGETPQYYSTISAATHAIAKKSGDDNEQVSKLTEIAEVVDSVVNLTAGGLALLKIGKLAPSEATLFAFPKSAARFIYAHIVSLIAAGTAVKIKHSLYSLENYKTSAEH